MDHPSFFNLLDYIYIIILLLSCVFGFVSGFTKVLLSTATWCGSCIVSSMISPFVRQLMAKCFENKIIIDVVSVIVAYIVVLVIALLMANYIADRVKQSFLSGVDRALGLMVGFIRGILIPVCVCAVFVVFDIPKNKFNAVKNSRVSSIVLDTMNNIVRKKKIQVRHKRNDIKKYISGLSILRFSNKT